MMRLSSHFTGFHVLSEEPSSSCRHLPTISCEKHVFLSPRVFPFDHRLDWVWIRLVWKIQHEVFLQKTVERAFQLADVQL